MTWTANLVKDEMIRAFQVLEDTTGRVGPDWFKNNWPEYRVEFADEVNQVSMGTNKTVTRVRIQRTAREISAMERVLLGHRHQPKWGAYILKEQAAMRSLVSWCFWEIRGRHAEAECRRRGWAYSTFRKRRDKAADIIAGSLNAAGIAVW